jgi:hypothetical protein
LNMDNHTNVIFNMLDRNICVEHGGRHWLGEAGGHI